MGLLGIRRSPAPHTWSAAPPVHEAAVSPPSRARLSDPPPRLPNRECDDLSRAAWVATQRYPGPLGDWIERELRSLAWLGVTFDPDGLTARLVAYLLATDGPAPGPPAA